MGLDMYLTGEKFHWTNWEDDSKNRKEDSFVVSTVSLKLGYWRKHPNLHGYIVKHFADGVDECQKIDLDKHDIEQILNAVKNDELVPTTGFFFGKSGDRNSKDSEESKWGQKQFDDTVEILENTLAWLKSDIDMISKSVYYHASW